MAAWPVKRLSPPQARVRALALIGLNIPEVAYALDLTPGEVSVFATRCRLKGWPLVFRRRPSPMMERARPLIDAGLGCAEIGRRLGIHRQAAAKMRQRVISLRA